MSTKNKNFDSDPSWRISPNKAVNLRITKNSPKKPLLCGSTLTRKKPFISDYEKEQKKHLAKCPAYKICKKLIKEHAIKNAKPKLMSWRTKSKVRSKSNEFQDANYGKTTFVTLTFQNHVEHRKATEILNIFLTKCRTEMKRKGNEFIYIWVAELQKENEVFTDNIHFHIFANKFWNIEHYQAYWIQLQKDNGIFPRGKEARNFQVDYITTSSGLAEYVTKYVTKNESPLYCQTWQCSNKVGVMPTSIVCDNSILYKVENNPENFCLRNALIKNEETGIKERKDWRMEGIKTSTDFADIYTIQNRSIIDAELKQLRDFNKRVFATPYKECRKLKIPTYTVTERKIQRSEPIRYTTFLKRSHRDNKKMELVEVPVYEKYEAKIKAAPEWLNINAPDKWIGSNGKLVDTTKPITLKSYPTEWYWLADFNKKMFHTENNISPVIFDYEAEIKENTKSMRKDLENKTLKLLVSEGTKNAKNVSV